jgi:hypothetical protein
MVLAARWCCRLKLTLSISSLLSVPYYGVTLTLLVYFLLDNIYDIQTLGETFKNNWCQH